MMTWLLGAMAIAAVPTGVRPVVAPSDLPDQLAAYAAAVGKPATIPSCVPLWPRVASLCFRLRDAGTQRWVTPQDLEEWKVDVGELRAVTLRRSRDKVAAVLQRTPVTDMQTHYWLAASEDGWSNAGLLAIDELVEVVGGVPIAVATPSLEVVVAWKPGDEDTDKVMTVGVREMYEQQRGSISPQVFVWDGRTWAPFLVAVPSSGARPVD